MGHNKTRIETIFESKNGGHSINKDLLEHRWDMLLVATISRPLVEQFPCPVCGDTTHTGRAVIMHAETKEKIVLCDACLKMLYVTFAKYSQCFSKTSYLYGDFRVCKNRIAIRDVEEAKDFYECYVS